MLMGFLWIVKKIDHVIDVVAGDIIINKKNVMHLQTIMVWKLLGEHVATHLKKRKRDPNMT